MSFTFNPSFLECDKDDVVVVTGVVKKLLPGTSFEVELDDKYVPTKRTARDGLVVATLCGKMKKNFITVVIGDPVVVWLSVHDLSKGRIMYRGSGRQTPSGEFENKKND